MKFSVYDKDNAQYFKEALESIINQKLVPNEIVLVVDGPINQEFKNNIFFDENFGPGSDIYPIGEDFIFARGAMFARVLGRKGICQMCFLRLSIKRCTKIVILCFSILN